MILQFHANGKFLFQKELHKQSKLKDFDKNDIKALLQKIKDSAYFNF